MWLRANDTPMAAPTPTAPTPTAAAMPATRAWIWPLLTASMSTLPALSTELPSMPAATLLRMTLCASAPAPATPTPTRPPAMATEAATVNARICALPAALTVTVPARRP